MHKQGQTNSSNHFFWVANTTSVVLCGFSANSVVTQQKNELRLWILNISLSFQNCLYLLQFFIAEYLLFEHLYVVVDLLYRTGTD